MLIDAAEDRGPMLFAWMGIVRALEANIEEALDTERQSLRRGKPKESKPRRESKPRESKPRENKLKGDRDASI